ncbi:MAG: methionine adenosyltransferase [Candidatus Marinimicrobia bacterium]|nr:methionine adenosyltransferase [Candidatus Neomarinimicrobiota bacterium]
MRKYLFTSESVTEGHPDKVCDAISDAILDNLLSQNKLAHVACETLVTKGMVVVTGEVKIDTGFADIERIVKNTLHEIGYTDSSFGMAYDEVRVISTIHHQSEDIDLGVSREDNGEQGAGDQGMMFGFACDETKELMPMPIQIAHRLTEQLAKVRKDKDLDWLRPDGKSQVSVEYEDFTPIRVKKVVIAAQHEDMIEKYESDDKVGKFIFEEIKKYVILPVLKQFEIPFDEDFTINGTGRFVKGGPEADAGLTGRKIIVDTYGGMGRHGGGAFSGKDPSKVDRSGAYMARYIAKNLVAAKLAKRIEIQLAYSIGIAEPVSVNVDSFGTGIVSDEKLEEIVRSEFTLKPAEIIRKLDLLRPIYKETAAYGHFGREKFPWENTDKADDLRQKYAKNGVK